MAKTRKDRLYRLGFIRKASTLVPYAVGAWVIGVFSRITWLNKFLFHGHYQRLRKLCIHLGMDAELRHAFSQYISCNFFASWRLYALSQYSDEVFSKWLTISGLEHMQSVLDSGRGVVLCNSHYGSGKAVLLALIRRGYDVHSFDRKNVFESMNVKGAEKLHSIHLGTSEEKSFFLKEVFQGRRALKNGGILHVAGDGYRGHSGDNETFLGRERRFPTSFAELAVSSGAKVVPVFGYLEPNGRMHMEFLPPLDIDDDLSNEDKVSTMVHKYKILLEAHWRKAPGEVHKNDLQIYFTLPVCGEGEDIAGKVVVGSKAQVS